jgi:ATP-binding cassette, subfamily B (MDR/TAP), member 9
MSSVPTVRAFGAESVEMTEFEDCIKTFLDLNVKSALQPRVFDLRRSPTRAREGSRAFLWWTPCEGHITSGQLIRLILYLSALSGAFNSLGGIYAVLVQGVGAADKVFELMNRKPTISTASHVDEVRLAAALQTRKHFLGMHESKIAENCMKGVYPKNCQGEIVLKDVQSSYCARPDRTVLDGLNLTLPAGYIVGTSGSGKFFFEPESGLVTIDGTSVSEICPNWLCRKVAVVQQEPVLCARCVKKHIIYGLEGTGSEPTQAQIEEAAALANAASFIESLPRGYDSEVGERELDGWSRLCVLIIRASLVVRCFGSASSCPASRGNHTVTRRTLFDPATTCIQRLASQQFYDLVNLDKHIDTIKVQFRTTLIVCLLHTWRVVVVPSFYIMVFQQGRRQDQTYHPENGTHCLS